MDKSKRGCDDLEFFKALRRSRRDLKGAPEASATLSMAARPRCVSASSPPLPSSPLIGCFEKKVRGLIGARAYPSHSRPASEPPTANRRLRGRLARRGTSPRGPPTSPSPFQTRRRVGAVGCGAKSGRGELLGVEGLEGQGGGATGSRRR